MTEPAQEQIKECICSKCGDRIDGVGSLQAKIVNGKLEHIKCPQKVVTKPTKDAEIKKKVREEIAKLAFQFAFLIDGKDIDEWWERADRKERWYDFADQIPTLNNLGIFSDEEVPELRDEEIDKVWLKYGAGNDGQEAIAQAQRDLTKGYRRVIDSGKNKM